jgi:hypothetical protein
MAKSLILFVLAGLLLGHVSSAPLAEDKGATQVPTASHVLPLTRNERLKGDGVLSDRFRRFRAVADTPAAAPAGIGTAVAAKYQVEYLVDVRAGGNKFSMIIDTGSSDTWFVKNGFQCIDPAYHRAINIAYCNFGPAFKGDFPGGQIPNQHFNISYGDGNGPFLNGQMGFSE